MIHLLYVIHLRAIVKIYTENKRFSICNYKRIVIEIRQNNCFCNKSYYTVVHDNHIYVVIVTLLLKQ